MRHEVISTKLHPLDCQCDLHREPLVQRWARAADPADELDAIRKGLIAGTWVAGVLAGAKYAPTVIDWLCS
ncbi:hypothetical protein [Sphingobium sp. DC-2]|uniref:hypothetical protein n=1 Tax=Sphingobium sp. DC-2 TaxID=1303256 RepID=UPI0004C4012A|nr:hypothetical protein [Sphingobium sp. DC-2]